ncbi:MAG: acyltransferase family protein, partial [Actinomycetota bacterium]|nr:acyltransferase family protein [Actinomycetota bacterium]
MVVPAIDGFRGLAALTVVLFHVVNGAGLPMLGGGSLRDVFMSGYVGVDFFFVISGFVLFLPTVLAGGRFGNVRAYGVRRAARILPAYYAVLVVAVVLQPLLSFSDTALPWDGHAGTLSFLLHLSFLQHSVGML